MATEIHSQGFDGKYVIDSDNGLVLNRRQTIIRTNDDLGDDAYMCHVASVC